MLFNSGPFLFLFLPITLFAFYGLGRFNRFFAKLALSLLSLCFYAVWRPVHLPLLLFSIVFNYFVGNLILDEREKKGDRVGPYLMFGIVVDLALLFTFKYLNFAADNLRFIGLRVHLPHIVLPLAISFFTFQKIAWLADCARGKARRISFFDFLLFASFFPQLIAGPIVHYSEVVPQFERKLFARFNMRELMVGMTIFAIGLFKKTVLADSVATFADPAFAAVDRHAVLAPGAAWLAAITYTVQLYMDFSGYSDMAIGLARMLGVRLPLNFHSPLRTKSIVEYWRRWHMTLQRFAVTYLYQPVAIPLTRWAIMNGQKPWGIFAIGVIVPSALTFLLLGVWHGAGWTFVIFGVLHAVYVSVNQSWRELKSRIGVDPRKARWAWVARARPLLNGLSWLLTIVCVMIGNVTFRSPSLHTALSIWSSMFGAQTSFETATAIGASAGPTAGYVVMLILCGLMIFLAPNTQQIMSGYQPAENWAEWKETGLAPLRWRWRCNWLGLLFTGLVLAMGVAFIDRGPSTFIYFNF